MILRLQRLPDTLRGPDDPAYRGRVPRRALLLAPDAAASLLLLEADGPLVYTDIYRSPEASLAARASKRGVQPPGFSGHNFGFSVDIDVDAVLDLRETAYRALLDRLAMRGWHCHRRDGLRGREDWHFNHLGAHASRLLALADPVKPATWSYPLEARIIEAYGEGFRLSPSTVQAALKKLRLYGGAIDGVHGPLTRQAIRAFQRAWGLEEDGVADEGTRRVLAVVSAEKTEIR